MARLPLILELNYREIKAVNFKGGFAGKTFENAQRLQFSSEDPAKRSEEVVNFLQQHYPDQTGAYLNLPAESVFIRELTLPFLEKKKVKEILPFELESMISHDMEDVVFDYYAYPNIEEKTTKVVVLGVPKEVIMPSLDLFRRNEISILGLYAPMDSFYHLVPFTGEKSVIMLHVSSLTTMLMVIEENEWVFARTIPLGYDILVHWLSQKWKKSFNESESVLTNLPAKTEELDSDFVKKHFQLSRNQGRMFVQSLEQFGDRLAAELKVSLQQAPVNGGIDIEKLPVIVSSDLSNQKIIENLLQKHSGNPVRSFPYDKSPMASLSRVYSIPVGGVLSQSSGKGLIFLKGDLKKSVVKTRSSGKVGVTIALGLGIAFFLASFAVDFAQRRRVISNMQEETRVLFKDYFNRKPNPEVSMVSDAKAILKKLRQKTEIFRLFFRSPKLSSVLVELNNQIGTLNDFKTDGINYTKKAITVRGTTDSFTTLDAIKATIEKSKCFSKVTKKNVRTKPAKDGGKRIKFTLEMTIVETSTEECR